MEELAPGVVLPFVHRPLSQYVNAMAGNGASTHRAPGRPGCRRRASSPPGAGICRGTATIPHCC